MHQSLKIGDEFCPNLWTQLMFSEFPACFLLTLLVGTKSDCICVLIYVESKSGDMGSVACFAPRKCQTDGTVVQNLGTNYHFEYHRSPMWNMLSVCTGFAHSPYCKTKRHSKRTWKTMYSFRVSANKSRTNVPHTLTSLEHRKEVGDYENEHENIRGTTS